MDNTDMFNTSSGDGAWQVQNSTKTRRLAPQSFISKSNLGAPPGIYLYKYTLINFFNI